jgi:hypothetical protein
MLHGRIHFVLALLIGLTSADNALAACQLRDGWIQNYEGDIGGRRVRLSLTENAGALQGVYVYADDLTDRMLVPRQTEPDSLEIDELDASGRVVARFVGRFETRDPRGWFRTSELQCEVITGSWARLESVEATQFYLRMDSGTGGTLRNRYLVAGAPDDAIINENAAKLWAAFRDNDRVDGRMIEFRTAEQFLPFFDDVFQSLPQTREDVMRDIPRHMFVNWRGVRLGPFTLNTNGHVIVY